MARGYRRRKYFINKGFQAKFIARFLAVSFAGMVLAVWLFSYLAHRKIDALLYSMRIPAVNAGNFLLAEAAAANGIALLLIVIVYAMTAKGIHTRMTRSLSRIRSDLRDIIAGDLGRKISLGEDEEFQELADDLNGMAGELRRRFTGIKEDFERIDASLKGQNGDPQGYARACREVVLPQIDAMEARLGEFKR